MMKDSPKTPNEWMAEYEARLSEGKGLTTREWDHLDELRRTVANRHAKLMASSGVGYGQ